MPGDQHGQHLVADAFVIQTGSQQVAVVQMTNASKPVDSPKPATARPLPVWIPPELLICDNATLARTMPVLQTTGPQQQPAHPIAPNTKLAIA